MDYCRTFGLSSRELRREPAARVRRWRKFLNVEGQAIDERRELERMKSEARRGRN